MPEGEVLAQMYGPNYFNTFGEDSAIDDPKEPSRVIEWLKRMEPGVFIDYGCGAGHLLVEAAKLHWQAIGVEYDEWVAITVEKETGQKVIPLSKIESLGELRADVLHLGDVIEHLTDLRHQMPQILKLIKPGGLLIAQGPLEANINLFTLTLRIVRLIRRWRQTEMPPYHVILATRRGQDLLFRRFGLEELEFTVREVSWPAPSRLSLSVLRNPRSVGLFVLRRISQGVTLVISMFRPGQWGNRYFYVGRLPHEPCSDMD